MKKLLTLLVLGSASALTACSGCGGGYYNDSYQWSTYNQPYYQNMNYGCSTCSSRLYAQPAYSCATCDSQTYAQPVLVAQPFPAQTCDAQLVNQPATYQDPNSQFMVNKPTTLKSDQDINNDVKGIVGSGWFSSGFDKVKFDVKDGVVTLSGSVNSQDDKNKIEKKLSELKGIKQVNNQITVQPQQK